MFVTILKFTKNGTMADSASDDSTSAVAITPTQALSNDSTSQQPQQKQEQPQQVQLQQPLALTATLLDVQQLDDYLLRLVLAKLQQVVSDSTTDTDASSKLSWLWPVLQLVTLWVTQGQTPAVRLLGLRVDVSGESGDNLASPTKNTHTNANANTNTRIGLLRYSVLGILVPFLYQKLKDWKTSVEEQEQQPQQESPDVSHAPPTHQQQQVARQQLARQRRLQVARLFIRAVDTMLPGVKLVLLLSCWTGSGTGTGVGRQHVPPNNIAARLCQWKYHTAVAQSQPQPQQNRLHVDFAHRRWLYESLLQTSRIWWAGLFLLTSVWGPDVRDYVVSPATRLVRDLSSRVTAAAATATALVFSSKTVNAIGARQQKSCSSCPICRRTDSDPVTVPVQGNCAKTCRQIYCYACLYTAAVRSRKVYCRTCREIITSCRFVDVDVDVDAELENAA
jgi:hypothetical protein